MHVKGSGKNAERQLFKGKEKGSLPYLALSPSWPSLKARCVERIITLQKIQYFPKLRGDSECIQGGAGVLSHFQPGSVQDGDAEAN